MIKTTTLHDCQVYAAKQCAKSCQIPYEQALATIKKMKRAGVEVRYIPYHFWTEFARTEKLGRS